MANLTSDILLKNIQKLFVWVPTTTTGFNGATVSTAAGNTEKIYFDSISKTIWVNGNQFGASAQHQLDLAEVKSILAGFASNAADPNKTVADALADLKSKLLGQYAADATPETIKGVDDRVKTIENMIAATGDKDNVINKLQEIIDWFANLPESDSGAKALVDTVAKLDGADTVDGSVKKQIKDAIDALDVTSNTVNGTNVHVKYKEENGIVTIESVSEDYAEVSFANPSDADATLTVKDGDDAKLLKASALADVVSFVNARLTEETTEMAVSAEGDDYVSATVNADNNKKVVVTTNVADLTATAGTVAAYDAEGAQTTAATEPTLTGTAKSLADASDIATKVKTYVDGKVAIEAARADAKVLSSIKALDATVTSDDAAIATVKVVETDGKLTDVEITTTSAGVSYTASTYENNLNKTEANLTATTSTGALTGADIAKIKSYIDDVTAVKVWEIYK